ncbi:hypothetical protein [Cellulosimicrobium sp. 22601]|uniref:hypothetical protein n=1 Tax=unclassified Cellulosimicrobium TaxID=2624466 RepID=UPI003F848072
MTFATVERLTDATGDVWFAVFVEGEPLAVAMFQHDEHAVAFATGLTKTKGGK